MLRAVLIAVLIAVLPSHVRAEARIALLIGNQVYTPKVGLLKNPHHDVALLGAALKQLGFQVTILKDADYRAMDVAVKRFITEVRSKGRDAISFFYYSGHGAANPDTQVNYLIPVDVADPNDGNLWYQSFQQNDLIDKLSKQAPNATHYVVFDACRNELNLSGPAAKAIGAEKGFVPVPQTPGLLIAYATAQGKTAADVGDNGGPYARALAAEILKPGIEAVTMFRNVQIRVKADIGQDPWLSFPALPEVYLAGGAGEKPAGFAAPPSPPAANEVVDAWDRTKDTTSIAALELFIERYKDTYYAGLARLRIDELKKKVALAVPPALSPAAKEAQPAAVITPSHCDGIEITVGQNERRCFKPGAGKTEYFRDCPDCPDMVVVPAGSFTMGSPASEPERLDSEVRVRVWIAAPFAVSRFAVTFNEWEACVFDDGCNGFPSDNGWGRLDRPLIHASWNDAKAYTAWLSRKTGKSYRLLSEAEREYVARAGTTTPFWWGSSITPKQANYDGSVDPYKGGGSKGEYRKRTLPVDSFAANPWGLYNVHGNVWEWTEDCWNESNTGNPGDGRPRTTGTCNQRVVRGGSWINYPRLLRSSNRLWGFADVGYDDRGFRLARTLAP